MIPLTTVIPYLLLVRVVLLSSLSQRSVIRARWFTWTTAQPKLKIPAAAE
jgi:hypothetical protein